MPSVSLSRCADPDNGILSLDVVCCASGLSLLKIARQLSQPPVETNVHFCPSMPGYVVIDAVRGQGSLGLWTGTTTATTASWTAGRCWRRACSPAHACGASSEERR